MHKIWLIIKREYWTRVRRRTFILSTFLAPFGFALLLVVPIMLSSSATSDKKIYVKNDSGLEVTIKDQKGLYFKPSEELLSNLIMNYEKEGYDGVIHIPQLNLKKENQTIRYYATKPFGISMQEHIKRELRSKLQDEKLVAAGIPREQLDNLNIKVSLSSGQDDEGKNTLGSAEVAAAAGGVMGFTIYIVLLIFGTMVMRGVIEEKTNRIVEVIISSVKPYQMMYGKIIGIGAVGLTQFLIWMVLMGVLYTGIILFFGLDAVDPANQGANPFGMTPDPDVAAGVQDIQLRIEELNIPLLLGMFLFYFLGGYMIYAALFAAIGASANDDNDNIQSLTFLVTVPIIISIFIMLTALEQPDSGLAFWASIVPFSSPIVMPARIAYNVDTWEIILSAVTLIAGVALSVWMAAKIYRTGILLYGKKITIKEIGKWLFYRN